MGGWSERVMGQKGFFDVERRLDAISALGDPLETIKKIVPWEDFRTDIEAVTETKPEERKSNAGRKPYDTILKFKIMVLQSLHNLSDDRTEYLIRDRISFMRFLVKRRALISLLGSAAAWPLRVRAATGDRVHRAHLV